MSEQSKSREPVAGERRTREGIEYVYVPSLGAWFGVYAAEGDALSRYLLQVPAAAETGEPVWSDGCDVCLVESQEVLDTINAAVGAAFVLSDFPGR